MNKIHVVEFTSGTTVKTITGLFQWNFGQILQIKGLDLPSAVEVHFALRRSEEALRRIGVTKDGVTEVEIPDVLFKTMMTSDYDIYAYVYVSDEEYGSTTHEIIMKVKSRPMPEDIQNDFDEIMKAVKTLADGKVDKNQGIANNGKLLGVVDGYVVLVDAPSGTTDAVRYVEQELTEEQQEQARANIGAANVTYDTETKTLNICLGGGTTNGLIEQIEDYVIENEIEKIVIDGVEVNLSRYAKKEETDRLSANKADKTALSQEKTERQAEIAVERERINNLAKLEPGSTTGDAELIDARVDKDGNTYDNVGEHIRQVSSRLSEENAELKGDLEEIAYPFNYCDIANMTVGKLVNRSDGTLSGNGDGGYIKIPVSVGDTLYVYGFCNDFITNGNVGAVYKEDGTFFQGIYATGDTFILPYTASGYSEVKYALINCKAFGSKMMIFKEPYEYSIHLPYGANIKNIIPNKSNLNDKTVLIEGDSIMYGYGSNGEGIGEILRDRYGFRLYKNAISGSTLAYVEGTENIRNRIVNGVKKPYDYIILDGGYNDYGKSLPLGSLMSESYPYASAPDATTVIGAMELIFQHIKKNYPKTKIYFVTPHKVNRVWVQSNSLNLTFKDYLDALISVCNLYSVPVIDLWNESGLVTYFSEMKVFTKDNDGLHPTKEGYEEFYLPVFQKSLGI